MPYQLNIFSGQLDLVGSSSSGGGTTIGGTVTGGTPNAILDVDASGKLGQLGPLTNGQLLIGSTGNQAVAATLTGTTNQISVTNSVGSITLSLPQSIDTNATPTFQTVTATSAIHSPNIITTGNLLLSADSHSITLTGSTLDLNNITITNVSDVVGFSDLNLTAPSGVLSLGASGDIDIAANGDTLLEGNQVSIVSASKTIVLTSELNVGNINITNVLDPVNLQDAATKNYVDSRPTGTGTVTSVSVASANGFAGTVANPTTTPAITLTTSITGVLKGNGTAISAATAGTDYSAGTSGLTTGLLKSTTTTGALTIATAGTDYQAPLTFSTGLTNTSGTVTVNASQNISTLSNLTSNGFVKTTGGTGALSIDTNTYLAAVTGDIAPTSFTGLANNTANQTITGFSFANTVSSFDALVNIQITATTNTFTTFKVQGTRRAGTWATNTCQADFTGDSITGAGFSISSSGQVLFSVGSISGFSAGTVKFRAITLS